MNFTGRFILFSITLFLILPVCAQFEPSEVEKSTQKIIFQSNLYYLHTVKKGHTLYSICKAYGVNETEIVKANPGVSLTVLSDGQVLKIPVKTENYISKKITTPSTESNQSFYYHTLQPKQTLFYLHQKYNVPLEVIYKYNPGSEQGVMIGQVIKIPKDAQIINNQVIETPEIQGTRYTVKDGDSLYIIARDYKIPAADVIYANQQLRWGLKPGQTIIIPSYPNNYLLLSTPGGDSTSKLYELPRFGKKECDSLLQSQDKKPVIIALLLPFYALDMYVSDTTQYNDSVDDGSVQAKTNPFRGKGALEFYEGFLMAIDTIKQEGIDIQLYTFDTEGDTNKVKSILIEINKIQPSLIVGPFMPDNVQLVSQYSQKNGIPFVPPLAGDNDITRQNNYMFLVNPSFHSEITASVNYLSQFYNQNIILAYKPGFIEQDKVNMFKKSLHDKSLPFLNDDTLQISEVILDGTFNKKMSDFLVTEKKNIFILISNNEPEVSNILSQLYFSSKYFDIEVFGLPQWQKFTNVSIEHMHGLQVTLFSPFFIDYNKENTKRFIEKCRYKLGFEPFKTSSKGSGMNYAYLGYDIGFYFIKAVNNYRKNITYCSDYIQSDPLLISDYMFERNNPIGCIENTYVNIIRYTKDFTLEKINYTRTPDLENNSEK